MAQRNCAAIHVNLVLVQTQRLDYGKRLRCKSLIQFDQINLIERQSRQFKNFGNRKYRPNTHFLRRTSGSCIGNKTRQRLNPEPLRSLRRHNNGSRAAV